MPKENFMTIWKLDHGEDSPEVIAIDMFARTNDPIYLEQASVPLHGSYQPLKDMEWYTICQSFAGKHLPTPFVSSNDYSMVTCEDCLEWIHS
jgi:hypothetical protein